MSAFMLWFKQAYLLKIPPITSVYFMIRPLQEHFEQLQSKESPIQLNKQQTYRVCLQQKTLHTYHLWQQRAEEAYCRVKLLEELIQTLADSGHTSHCYKKSTHTLTFKGVRMKDKISSRRRSWKTSKTDSLQSYPKHVLPEQNIYQILLLYEFNVKQQHTQCSVQNACKSPKYKRGTNKNKYIQIISTDLMHSARNRAHLWAMLRPASKKQTRIISETHLRVLESKLSFPSFELWKQVAYFRELYKPLFFFN